MSDRIIQIKNWHSRFENNRTRELKKLDWVPIPNKHDGDGFTDLINRPNGMALFGGWMLIIQTASKCDPRGTLLRDSGKPHTFDTIARMSHGDPKIIKDAIEVCVEIGWLEYKPYGYTEVTEIPHDDAVIPHDGAVLTRAPARGRGMEGKGREGNEGNEELCGQPGVPADPPEPAVLTFKCAGAVKSWDLTQTMIDSMSMAFPHLDILQECRKAAGWEDANPSSRKTAVGKKRFLFGWLTRAQDRGGGQSGNGNGSSTPPREYKSITKKIIIGAV